LTSIPSLKTTIIYLAAVDDQAKIMCWHYRLGHLSFAKLKQLALNGEIPRCLAKIKLPTCTGCLFGAMTKVPWRGQETSSEVFVAIKAGKCVSVDQLVSTHVRFIAQLKGTLTKKRYTVATVFVDHYSRLKYVHLKTKLTSEETMEAKQAFEHFAKRSMVSASSTTTATMDVLQTTPSRTAAAPKDSNSPSVGSMPTSKMALQRNPSEISGRVCGSNSSMRANAGLPVLGHQANLRESSKSKELAKLRLQVLVVVKANDACESKKEIMRLRE
jgi:hypothetical protein